jgi:uncharacterized protein YndB with AHSA1/START domain
MTERSVTHATFVIDRTYEVSPARVFAAWADPQAKARWMVGPDDQKRSDYRLDFRIGGLEHIAGGPEGGPVYTYDAVIQDIVPNKRIVATNWMHMDDLRISVSVATVEFLPVGNGTRLILTEQGAYLDGLDTPAAREQGTAELLDKLGVELRRQPANA